MTSKTLHEELVLADLDGLIEDAELRATRSDVAFTETLTFNGVGTELTFEDWGTVATSLIDWTELVAAPAGFKGRVIDVAVHNIQETFNTVTVGATVQIGTAADPNAYAETGAAGIAAATAAAPANAPVTHNAYIPGGADFQVAGFASDHGTPAGRGTLSLTIAWIKE